MKGWALTVLIGSMIVSAAQPAHAYTDAAANTILAQLFLGGLAGWIVFVRLVWTRWRSGGKDG